MNRFAILTIALLALAGWLGSNSRWAFPDDAGDENSGQSDATDETGNEDEAAQEETTPETQAELDLPELPPDDEALAIFNAAQQKLFEHSSIRARYREIASFPNRAFIAGGTYLSGGALQMRLEYEIEIGDMRGTLLQVCDGQVSWTRQEAGPIVQDEDETPSEDETYSFTSRRDINQIRRAMEGQEDLEAAVAVADLGIGGLPAMLAGIEQMMVFDGHETGEWDYRVVEMGEEVWRTRHCIIVTGRWSDEISSSIPGTAPARVRIYFSEETLFPERIVYLTRTSSDGDLYRPLLELQFLDVEFDVPVNPDAFTFVSPPGTEEHDETRQFLEMLELIRQAREQAAEAESSETPDE